MREVEKAINVRPNLPLHATLLGVFIVCLPGSASAGPAAAASVGPPTSASSEAIDTQTAMTESAVDDRMLNEKLLHLDDAFNDMRPGGIAWVVTWGVVFQGLFAWQLSDAILGTENWMTSRPTAIVGAVEAEISFVLTVALPFRPMTARRQFRNAPANSASEKQEKLALGEQLLCQASDDIDFVHSWISHLIYFGISIAGGAIVWGVEGRDGWKHGLISAGSGIVITLANIWSAPIKAKKHYNAYRRKYGPIADSAYNRPIEVQLVMLPSPTGLGLALMF